MNLILEGKVVREIERRALEDVDPTTDTTAKRRNLIRIGIRDGMQCHHCHKELVFMWMAVKGSSKWKHATFDHVIPKKFGGTYHPSNGVLSCRKCNAKRGHMSIEEFHREGALPKGELKRREVERKRKNRERKANREPKRQTFVMWVAYTLYLHDAYHSDLFKFA